MISENEFKILQQKMAGPSPKLAAKAKLLEKHIEAACTQLLAHDGWRSLKTDPVSDRKRGKGFGELGMADRLYIRYGPSPRDIQRGFTVANWLPEDVELMWIEWKRPGGIVADHQLEWHRLERKRGAMTLIAGEDFPATIEGFWDWYRHSGFSRIRRGFRPTGADREKINLAKG